MTASATSLLQLDAPWTQSEAQIIVGKDILELLSSSMYVDPMSIFREYVQNAADSIDEAKAEGIIASESCGQIALTFDETNRSAKIRDNGIGIKSEEFEARLTAFGASRKRGTTLRGFRGVGRLAGIGYCQELVFRTRALGEARVSEIKWDCRIIKSLLRSTDGVTDLKSVMGQAVSSRRVHGKGWPEHFFEVELRGIVRHRDDKLMNPVAVRDYLSQIAPVPFLPKFKFQDQIESELARCFSPGRFKIEITGMDQVYRPHRNTFAIKDKISDSFQDIEFIRIPGIDGTLAAIGWILHHGYMGAIPAETRFRGLRFRVGNIQVGEPVLLEDLFVESRFNSWSVGEIHILDPRIVPNGRRDHFEQNAHYLNVLNHLGPIAREISLRCRRSSMKRNWLKAFERHQILAQGKLKFIRQGSLGRVLRARLLSEAKEAVREMEKIASKEALKQEFEDSLRASLKRLSLAISKVDSNGVKRGPLSRMRGARKKAFEEVFALIYECSQNEVFAKHLIDRILVRVK